MNFSYFIIPFVIVIILIFGIINKVPVFEAFLEGAKEGLTTSKNILPSLIALMTAVGIFRASGCLDIISDLISPLTDFFGIPDGVIPLMLLKPFSGSGSIAILDNIFTQFGPDSLTGRVASVLAGSTETTFYTLTVYFGSVGIKKTRHALPSAVSADLAGFILSAFAVSLLF